MSLRKTVPALCAIAMMAASGPSHAQRADVIHWWTSGGESRAVAVFAEEYRRRGGTWLDSAVVGGPAARASAINRIAGGNPPTAMQWNNMVSLGQLADQGLLANLDRVAARGRWAEALPPVLYERIRRGGHVVAAPVNIMGINLMFYSTRIFADLGLQVPTNWDEFFVAADRIKAAGLIPLAIGGQPFQYVSVFSNVVLGLGGVDLYRQVYVDHDRRAAGSPTMVRVFEVMRRLTNYIDGASPNRRWNDTSLLVQNNRAAMQIIGDYAKGEFLAAGLTPGREFGCAPAPGTAGYFMFAVDTFAFPRNDRGDQPEARELLAEVLMDPQVQIVFNRNKGALPARRDVRMTPLDACSEIGEAIVANAPDRLVPAIGVVFDVDADGQIGDLLSRFWSDPRVTPAQAAREFASIVASAAR